MRSERGEDGGRGCERGEEGTLTRDRERVWETGREEEDEDEEKEEREEEAVRGTGGGGISSASLLPFEARERRRGVS